jgi:hypothetical protein
MTTTLKKHRDMSPGTTVAYTGKFLRSIGEMTGQAGLDKFVVQECHCDRCEAKIWVAVNQLSQGTDPHEPDYDAEFTRELKAELGHTWRHIGTDVLYVVGQLDLRNNP